MLRINMDETSLCLFQGTGKGTVFHQKKRDPPSEEPAQFASRKRRRTCITHVAFICDRPDLQPLLPQFLIGNHSTFLQRDLEGLRAACPSNVFLVRQKSAWNNAALQVIILRRLGAVLRPYLGSLQPILFMDACRLHFVRPVITACFAQSLWPIFVPARLTWLLQPCDTHAFQRYKAFLQSAYQCSRADTARAELSIGEFLSCVYRAIRYVLQGQRWALAFDRDGFGHGQSGVAIYIRRQLQLEDMVVVSASLPSDEQLRKCFPRRARVYIAGLLPPAVAASISPRPPVGYRLFARRPAGRPMAPSLDVRAAEHRAGPVGVLRGIPVGREPRTRSEHRLVAELSRGRPFSDP